MTLIPVLVIVNVSRAMDNEPTNFRGTKFESTVKEFRGIFEREREEGDMYFGYFKNEKLHIGSVELESVDYLFLPDGRLYMVNVFLKGTHANRLYRILKKIYGEGENYTGNTVYWKGEKIDISLGLQNYGGRSIFSFTSVIIVDEYAEELKKKDSKAENDL